jgi:hypothetical protein
VSVLPLFYYHPDIKLAVYDFTTGMFFMSPPSVSPRLD